jgi:hypothetical protein
MACTGTKCNITLLHSLYNIREWQYQGAYDGLTKRAENKTPNNFRILVAFLRTTPKEITVTTHCDNISLPFLATSSPVTQT